MPTPIPTTFFVRVVVRFGDRFLLVQEREHGQGWYLPAGRAEPGETLAEAAIRETMEEAGIRVVLEGLLRIEHEPLKTKALLGAVFLAHPADDDRPKDQPDDESLGAAWLRIDEIARLALRDVEVLHILRYVVQDGPVYPVDLVDRKGWAARG